MFIMTLFLLTFLCKKCTYVPINKRKVHSTSISSNNMRRDKILKYSVESVGENTIVFHNSYFLRNTVR